VFSQKKKKYASVANWGIKSMDTLLTFFCCLRQGGWGRGHSGHGAAAATPGRGAPCTHAGEGRGGGAHALPGRGGAGRRPPRLGAPRGGAAADAAGRAARAHPGGPGAGQARALERVGGRGRGGAGRRLLARGLAEGRRGDYGGGGAAGAGSGAL